MQLDFGNIVGFLGEKVVGEVGAPLGLNDEQSVKLATALAHNIGAGKDLAIKGAAAETGIPQDVAQAMMDRLYEVGKEKLLQDTGIAQQVADAQAQAVDAAKQAAGGFLGRLFGRKG